MMKWLNVGKSRNDTADTGLKTEGVMILPAMDQPDEPQIESDPLDEFRRPGYAMCSYVKGFVRTEAGPVPRIKTAMDMKDRILTVVVRMGIRRHNYKVSPGLYCVGTPDKHSEVLVTANFKLTFDHLRRELNSLDAWILVLDTRGINVWCAAGKGTFSTKELVKRVKLSHIDRIVDHRRLVVPQLGATGVSAGDVRKQSGFRVIYGPIRAADIPRFLENGRKADKNMRLVTFTFFERLILTPIEVHILLKPALITLLVLFILSGFGPGLFSFAGAWSRGLTAAGFLVAGIVSGAVVTPVLLPYFPFKAFAAKGILSGLVFVFLGYGLIPVQTIGPAAFISLCLFMVVISSYLAMNFTGSTPFTSPSGVEKEMKQFIPVQLIGLLISTGLWVYSAF